MNVDWRDQWKIRPVVDASSPECDHVRAWLREHNLAVNRDFMLRRELPEHRARPLVLVAESEVGILGGLIAETQFSWLRLIVMAVRPDRRSQGVGSALLTEAEREAAVRGCKYVFADTMEYQAPEFYVARGFTIVGRIPDWDSLGHAKFYLMKLLS